MGFFRRAKKAAATTTPSLSRAQVLQQVTDYVASQTQLLSREELEPETPLFTAGVLDSLALIELVVMIQTCFGMNLSHSMEVTPENLDTIAQIANAVCQPATSSPQMEACR